MDGALRETIKRRVRKAVKDGANIIIVQLDNCGGGNIEDARALADYFIELQKGTTDPPVLTISAVPEPHATALAGIGLSLWLAASRRRGSRRS